MTTTPTAGGVTVTRDIVIAAPRETVFRLVSDQQEMARWMPMTLFEARTGGSFRFAAGEWVAVGEVLEVDPPRRISYTWDWENQPIGAPTRVDFDLEETPEGTLVRLTHSGFPTPETAASHEAGWEHYAGRLAEVCAGNDPGPDAMAGG